MLFNTVETINLHIPWRSPLSSLETLCFDQDSSLLLHGLRVSVPLCIFLVFSHCPVFQHVDAGFYWRFTNDDAFWYRERNPSSLWSKLDRNCFTPPRILKRRRHIFIPLLVIFVCFYRFCAHFAPKRWIFFYFTKQKLKLCLGLLRRNLWQEIERKIFWSVQSRCLERVPPLQRKYSKRKVSPLDELGGMGLLKHKRWSVL